MWGRVSRESSAWVSNIYGENMLGYFWGKKYVGGG